MGDNIMSEEQTVDNLTGSIIEVTDSHLVFTAGLDGFSPFALAWPASATGSLSVSKTVSGSAGETDREFKFTVTLSGRQYRRQLWGYELYKRCCHL